MSQSAIMALAAILSLYAHAGVSAADSADPAFSKRPERWYSAEQAASGGNLFGEHCAGCHGTRAEGTPSWRKRDASGNYPPPPLNGTAHAWHHPLSVLDGTIVRGGAAMGGVMPGFGHILDRDQRLAVIAFFQDFWSDEIYLRWKEINGR